MFDVGSHDPTAPDLFDTTLLFQLVGSCSQASPNRREHEVVELYEGRGSLWWARSFYPSDKGGSEGTTSGIAGVLVWACTYKHHCFFLSGAGDQPNRGNVGVVVTDGKSMDFQATWNEAIQARTRGITMLAVGVGSFIRTQELEVRQL